MPNTTPPTRRDFLMATAAGLAGVSAASGTVRPPLRTVGTAKACIIINLVGGPSHLDTFDPKPDAPAEYRGPFRPIPTRVPGVHVSELFPKLAGVADKFSLIRSMHHTAPPIHEAGFQMLNTGRLFRDGPEWPCIGAVMSYLRGTPDAARLAPWGTVETGVQVSHGQGGGWLPREMWPWCNDKLFSSESEFENQYGGTRFGDACWYAMIGADWGGYPFTTINMFPTVFDSPSWDCHADGGSLATTLNDYCATVAPSFDMAFTTLLTDLEDRGLLDTTLVVASGEFGRTPKLNANGGRDHWANCWTALVAGGGVKGGRVVGASDKHGTEPADRPVTPQELVATVFHALGVSPDATIPGPAGAPVAVYPAAAVNELF